ncbi:Hsp33 family molecular chaperone HslO [Agarivorans sp. TSD2052]|uniref:Hsp33 family molecular chaperone HslO n=1 Tax=Agarivorans sp. TSD2052 TaxID=2937286 RepID=UPI00200D1BAF|nr:Hsp33 family molecular chaperone HslO [Agarivorans sp. TSD2052]UPW18255.1 Hsp33 family molecular chaperone HslO [Agarivorans sp. TSD2052]
MKQDILNRYTFEEYNLRGELVQLQQSYQEIIEQQNYPVPVQSLLGELLAATCLLTATLKFEGDITVQLQGDGPLKVIAVSGTDQQQMRGIARYDGAIDPEISFAELVGKGHIVITISPTQGERYQGIVNIEPEGVAASIESYFQQSEQLNTRIWLFTGMFDGRPHASGLFLQALPGSEQQDSEHFELINTLSSTTTAQESFELDAEQLLYRLYHEHQVRLYEPQDVCFKCSCSKERCETALSNIDHKELLEICHERGHISMHCDYCGHDYKFNEADVENIFTRNISTNPAKIH